MNYLLSKTFTIFGSHKIKDHEGCCSKLHGHEYKITLNISSEVLDGLNMVIDVYDLEKLFWDILGGDHLDWNDFYGVDNVTMEFLASRLYRDFKEKYFSNSHLVLVSVVVSETDGNKVTYPYS